MSNHSEFLNKFPLLPHVVRDRVYDLLPDNEQLYTNDNEYALHELNMVD